VEAAVRRQIEQDDLRELIEANERIHGPLTAEEIEAARVELFGPTTHDEVA
jgi:predicted RNA-binding protein